MALFKKRLTCFYCGKHPAKQIQGPIANLKFHCEHCDADNYLDQNGEITDPPNDVTNPPTADSPVKAVDFSGNDLFCSLCLRNQHLYTSSLAAFWPEDEDAVKIEYGPKYEEYRRDLEARYPQVCETCEPRVKEQMRKAGYDAKADNLRRMMDRTRDFKANQRARERSWQSLLVYLGSLLYWTSIAGQLGWDITCAINLAPFAFVFNPSSPILIALMHFAIRITEIQWIPSKYSFDPSSAARIALIMGCLSFWWNPKLRMKVLGRLGKFSKLAEYYQIQLIFMVARAIFWSLFKDPSASGIDAQQCVTGHLFMILFTPLCVYLSRITVKYEPRVLVNWSDNSWENKPMRSAKTSPSPDDLQLPQLTTPQATTNNADKPARFPFEKLRSAWSSPAKPRSPSQLNPPSDHDDDMDWTPVQTLVIQPTVSVYQRDKPSVPDAPSPFRGHIPAVSKPPAWDLRASPVKPAGSPVQPNPFHRSPTHPPLAQPQSASPEPVFQAPRFFPQSDYQNDTGLEVMFDRAFSFGPGDNSTRQPMVEQPHPRTPKTTQSQIQLQIKFFVLLATLCVWTLSWKQLLPINERTVEIFALGLASIISGLALLESLGKPLEEFNGYEIVIFTLQLMWAVYYMLLNPREPAYFEPLALPGTLLLLMFMTGEFGIRLLTSPNPLSQPEMPTLEHERESTHSSPSLRQSEFSQSQITTTSGFSSPEHSVHTSFHYPHGIEPPFALEATTPKEYHYGNLYSDHEQDSDTETVASTATSTTNNDIRYGNTPRAHSSNVFFSHRRPGLSPSFNGLSLDNNESPTRRMTRSQTLREPKRRGF